MERESPTPPPMLLMARQLPPTEGSNGNQQTTSACDGDDTVETHPALQGLRMDANVEGSGIEDDSQFIINSLIFQLTAAQVEVTHL